VVAPRCGHLEASVIRHAWLQKHATPVTSGGEFHWYPASDATPELVERSRGVTPPAVMWELGPGRVVWTQVFAATAPSDNRRYVGLVASTVEGPGSAADLLHRLVPPPPRPWRDGDGSPGLALPAPADTKVNADGNAGAVWISVFCSTLKNLTTGKSGLDGCMGSATFRIENCTTK